MRGSIIERQRDKGLTYQAKVSRFDEQGRRRQISRTFTRKKDAEAWLAKTIAGLNAGTLALPDTTTVAQLLATYRRTVLAHKVRSTTLYDYDLVIARHILPAWGERRVQSLTTAGIQQWYAERLAAGVGARTLQVAHQLLRQTLEAAVDWGIVAVNPAARARPPAAPARELVVWTPEQAAAFLQANRGAPLHAAYVVSLATGLRQGELFGLRWRDVDLEAGTLAVRQQVVVDKGARLAELKTPAARRTVALPADAVAALRRQRADVAAARLRSSDWQDLDLVFPTGRGTPWLPGNATKRWLAALRRAPVPRIRWHDMRHSHASWLLQAGVPVTVVAERLGHASPRITLQTYAHVMPDTQAAAAAAIQDVLFGVG